MALKCTPIASKCITALNDSLFWAVVVVLAWIFGGAAIYWLIGNCSTIPEFVAGGGVQEVEYCSWTFAQSYYYSVQAGLSIGFGLLSETKELSRLYTIFHILAGSSFVVGALVYFLQLILVKQAGWQSDAERKLARFSRNMNADGYSGFNLRELHELMICHPSHFRDVVMRLNDDTAAVCQKMNEFNDANLATRAALVDKTLVEACEKLEEFQNHSLTISDLLQLHQREATWRQRIRSFITGHATMVRQMVAATVWFAAGVIYICIAEDASFISGMYFAVSSMSTAGLYAVTSTSDGSVFWIVGTWTLIGVPLYGIMLGSYASLLVEQYGKEQVANDLHQRMNTAEVEFLSHLLREEHKEEVNFTDYAQIELLRLGLVDRDMLAKFREEFDRHDVDGSGKIPTDAFLSSSHAKLYAHRRQLAGNPSNPAPAEAEVAEQMADIEEETHVVEV